MSYEIEKIVRAVQDVIAENDLEDHCIHTSALLTRVFHECGFSGAYLLTVGVEVFNPALLRWIKEHGAPESEEQWNSCGKEGGIMIHLGAGHDQPMEAGVWKGHLVVVVPEGINGRDCMIDLSVTQVNKHCPDIKLPPIVFLLKSEGSFVLGETSISQDVNGSRVTYTAYPDDQSFDENGNCLTIPGIDLALSQVMEKLRAS